MKKLRHLFGLKPNHGRAWGKHGRETLERLRAQSPNVLLAVMVKLAEIHQRRLPEPPKFDRRRWRPDIDSPTLSQLLYGENRINSIIEAVGLAVLLGGALWAISPVFGVVGGAICLGLVILTNDN
jgi:hypothetical protein